MLCKARLLVKGFQEEMKLQSDSPTSARERFKSMIALSANENLEIYFIDICPAFLQTKSLD